jgi:hypothetical protein
MPYFSLLLNYVKMILIKTIVKNDINNLECASPEKMQKKMNGGRFDILIFDKLLD